MTLSAEERARIEEAVRRAESATSGEIVPYVVPRSSTYQLAVWRAGATGAALAAVFLLAFVWLYGGWGYAWLLTSWGAISVMVAATAVSGALAAVARPVRRWFTGSAVVETAVHQRAMQAFLEEEVFATRDRTGILVFVSLAERRIEVIGDAGINAAVDSEDWSGIVRLLQDRIREGRLADGLVEAIGRCGDLLVRKGLEIAPDDRDELENRLRMGE